MWLSSSSVGRKFIMALTGAFLVLFVTFHCLMNAVAICWPAAYNSVCEFLGANWYALIGSAVIAVFVIVHIIYAVMLTLQNRKARGSERYAMSVRPKDVEWSSQNMLVLGIVILAFLVVHLIQFWAKMQLQEIRGAAEEFPPAAGTLFLQLAFQEVWTPIVYIIGFIALWFHLNHGFWSMFQSVGWDNTAWIARLKKISYCWVTVVVLLFIAEAIVFTVKAHDKYYLTNETLRDQYKDMIIPMLEKDFGPDAAQISFQVQMMPFEVVDQQMRQIEQQMGMQVTQMESPEGQTYMQADPNAKEQAEKLKSQYKGFKKIVKFLDFLKAENPEPEAPVVPNVEQAN